MVVERYPPQALLIMSLLRDRLHAGVVRGRRGEESYTQGCANVHVERNPIHAVRCGMGVETDPTHQGGHTAAWREILYALHVATYTWRQSLYTRMMVYMR
eukprot:1388214-Pyramimonas_sp.AAC.1